MRAVGSIREKIKLAALHADDRRLMRSREYAVYASLVLLPFLLVSTRATLMPIAALTGLMLAPPAIGWLLAGRGLTIEARLLQAIVASGFLFVGFLSGFGAGLSLALLLLILVEPLLFTPMPHWTGRRVGACLAGLFCIGVVIAQGTTEARLTSFYGPACLAFIPSLLQTIYVLGSGDRMQGRAEIELGDQHRLDQIALAVSREAALLIDRGGRVRAVGSNAREIIELHAADLIGRGFFERLHLLDRPALLKACADMRPGLPTPRFDLRLRLDPAHSEARIAAYAEFEARLASVDAAGSDDGTAGVIVLLLSKRPTLLAAPSHLSEDAGGVAFLPLEDRHEGIRHLAEISHHLRTPLHAVMGFADLLANPATQPKSQGTIAEYGQIIRTAGEDLVSVVDLLIDMLRVQSGAYTLAPESLSPLDVIDVARRELSTKAGHAGLDLVGALPPVEWVGDRKAAAHILTAIALAVIELQPCASILVKVTAGKRDIAFDLSASIIDAGYRPNSMMPERDLTKQLPQSVCLSYDFACLLARYQGGGVALETGVDGTVHGALRIPLTIKTTATGTEPVRLDDFRRADQRKPTKPREPLVKKHA